MARTPSLGNAIRTIRKARDLTQEDFSNLSSRTYLSSLERGLKSPTLGKIEDLSTVLDVHPLTILLLAYAGMSPTEQKRIIDRVIREAREIPRA
jgi:transcriptional regulator with XRE-family HTH domain